MSGGFKELLSIRIRIKLPEKRPPSTANLSELSDEKLRQIIAESASIMARNSGFQNSPEYTNARRIYSQATEIIDRRNGLYPDL